LRGRELEKFGIDLGECQWVVGFSSTMSGQWEEPSFVYLYPQLGGEFLLKSRTTSILLGGTSFPVVGWTIVLKRQVFILFFWVISELTIMHFSLWMGMNY